MHDPIQKFLSAKNQSSKLNSVTLVQTENVDTSTSHNTGDEHQVNENEEVPDVLKVRQRKDKPDTAEKWTKENIERLNELITMVQER